jgi:hypothetical protein
MLQFRNHNYESKDKGTNNISTSIEASLDFLHSLQISLTWSWNVRRPFPLEPFQFTVLQTYMNILSFLRTINNCNKACTSRRTAHFFRNKIVSSYQTTALFTTPVAATYRTSCVHSVCLQKGTVSDEGTIASVLPVTTHRTRIFLRDTSGQRVEEALTRTSCIVTTHPTGKK